MASLSFVLTDEEGNEIYIIPNGDGEIFFGMEMHNGPSLGMEMPCADLEYILKLVLDLEKKMQEVKAK